MNQYIVTNIDGLEKVFLTDRSLIEYAQQVYKENEEGDHYKSDLHFLPENISNAKEYIHEYCPDLTLEEF